MRVRSLRMSNRRVRSPPDLIIPGLDGAIAAKTVTYDFHRLMDGATLLMCSEFGDAIIDHMPAGVAVGS